MMIALILLGLGVVALALLLGNVQRRARADAEAAERRLTGARTRHDGLEARRADVLRQATDLHASTPSPVNPSAR